MTLALSLYDNNFVDKSISPKWHIATDIDKLVNYLIELFYQKKLYYVKILIVTLIFYIEHFYDHIISSIQLAISKCIPSSTNDSKFKIIPCWINDYVKESYAISRDALKWWISNNRSRFGIIYHDMRTTRAQFKYALRITKRNEESARADALARDLYDKDVDKFWSGVSQLNRSSSLLSNYIEGVTDEKTFLTTGRNILISC